MYGGGGPGEGLTDAERQMTDPTSPHASNADKDVCAVRVRLGTWLQVGGVRGSSQLPAAAECREPLSLSCDPILFTL